jgi:hypothetical protein
VNCAAGGTRVDSGLDDGAPSGTPRNATLETGEIDLTRYVCNGSSSSGGSGIGTLRDSAGNVLGTAISATSTTVQLRSSTGYFYSILWTGGFVAAQIYYSNTGCTGTAWLNAASTQPRLWYSKFALYEGATGDFDLVSNADANGNATNVTASVASVFSASCAPITGSVGGFVLQRTTRAALGIPATITPPLTIN